MNDDSQGHEPIDHLPTPETLVADAELQHAKHAALEEAMAQLGARERRIMQLRFMGGEVTSLAAIGRDLGLSRERVRQLAQQAESTLRNSILAKVA